MGLRVCCFYESEIFNSGEREIVSRVHCHSGCCGLPRGNQYKVMHFWLEILEECVDGH